MWKRVLVQIGVAVVCLCGLFLSGFVLCAFNPMAVCDQWFGFGASGTVVLGNLAGALPFVSLGALASALNWALVRRPKDALASCSLALLAGEGVAWMMVAKDLEGDNTIFYWGLARNTVAVFGGCLLATWLLQRREARKGPPADASASG
jgi:hypothetical protein